MSQYTEEIQGSPMVTGTLGTNIETVVAGQSSIVDGGSKVVLTGRLKTKAEIASGATIFTIPLRHAPKTARIINAFVEPSFRIEITTGGLVKAVGAIASGKEIGFEGLEYTI